MSINPFKNIIGLDISDFKIRFIQIDSKKKNKTFINSYGEIDVPKNHIINGEIKNNESIINLIKELIKKPQYGKIEKKYVNSSLPEGKTYIKVFEIPNVPSNELKGTVSWGIEQNIPIKLEDAYFDWYIINHDKNTNKLRILVSVAPKNIVDNYTDIIKKSGLVPISLENESTAITRCLIDQNANVKSSLMIIDLGRSRTNLIIYSHNTVQYTSTINVSGHEMTKSISKTTHLSYEDAEKAKIIYGLDEKKIKGEIKKVLAPIIDKLIDKINENIKYFDGYLATKSKINTILLTGSVSQTLGLSEYMQQKLNMNVIISDPWSNLILLKNQKDLKNKNFYPFATSIGLAIKKFY